VVRSVIREQEKSDQTEEDSLASVYFNRNLDNLFEKEGSLLTHQRKTARTMIYDYISTYIDRWKYDERILYIAMSIFDACLERMALPHSHVQRAAIVSMFIALKFDNGTGRGRGFYKRFPEVASSGDLADLDAQVFLRVAHRVLHLPTIHDFLEHFSRSLTALQRSRALFFVESSYRSVELPRKHLTSKLAALAVYLAVERRWSDHLSCVTRLAAEELEPCSADVYATARDDTSAYVYTRFKERAKLEVLFGNGSNGSNGSKVCDVVVKV